METGTEAPADSVVGKFPMEIQLSAPVTERMDRMPPPELETGRSAKTDCVLVESVEKVRIRVPSVSCGGGAVTMSVTLKDCVFPKQTAEVQVTATVALYGEPDEDSWSALAFRETDKVPGVLEGPVTVSQGAEATVEYFRI